MEKGILKPYMDKIKRITKGEKAMCLGKTKHKSVLAASEHMHELMKFSLTPHLLHYYKCDFCGNYHCGNRKE